MITSSKLSGFVDRLTGDKRPITADVFLTDYCNNKCGYCRYNNRSGEYMKADTFSAILDRLLALGVKGVILTGGGEPTINPDFDIIRRDLERRGIPYGVNTNFNKFVYCVPVFLKVSIDAGTADEYRKMRGVDRLEVVLNNIRRYAEYIRHIGAKTRIGVQCVTTSMEQVTAFYEKVKNLYVDYIQFRPIEQKGEPKDYSGIVAAVEKLQNDQRVYKSFKYDLVGWVPEKCWANWAAICVNVQGDVLYCCHRPDEKIGSVFDEDILEKLQSYEPDMSLCESPCRLSGANRFVEQMDIPRDIFFI